MKVLAKFRGHHGVLAHPMVWRFGINQMACVTIALLLWQLLPHGHLPVVLVYSLCIGNAIWLLVDGGRALLHRAMAGRLGVGDDWLGWLWMVPLVVVGTVLGYSLGSSLADLWLGRTSPSLWRDRAVVLASLATAAVVTGVFNARERLQFQRREAESARRAAAELQLRLLQSQLEPHMLFNTLANLRVLIGLDARRAQAMLDHLIAFLRSTLAGTRTQAHPLAAEFDHLQAYLALMAIRMGNRLSWRLDLPDELRQHPVPPLLLQPLVENAIQHGLEPHVKGGRIDIEARRDGQDLRLRVRDTGLGLPCIAGRAHDASDQPGPSNGFGLEHVRRRLSTLHGALASMQVRPAALTASDPDGGTEVLITMPWVGQDGLSA